MFLGLCASIGCAGLVHAQGGPSERVTWQGTVSLVTTGNVTYAEYTWLLLGCECEYLVSTGPVIRNGSNFWYNFDLGEHGGPCPQFIANMTTTAALGTLAPGTYTLTTTSWSVPITTNTFIIPTNSPVLQTIGFAADGSFLIQLLNGVTNVSYVLQCSTNYVNWTSLSTNSVGQPLRDPCPVLPGSRFYRVQVLQQ